MMATAAVEDGTTDTRSIGATANNRSNDEGEFVLLLVRMQ